MLLQLPPILPLFTQTITVASHIDPQLAEAAQLAQEATLSAALNGQGLAGQYASSGHRAEPDTPTSSRTKLEDQTSKLHITDNMTSDDGNGTPENSTPQAEATPAAAAPKPKRVRTGCLTCRERHLKCDEGMPICQNCRKSNRQCKRGVRLNFIDTQVRDTNVIPPTADWQVGFQDESRDIASEYKGGAARYAGIPTDPDAMDILKESVNLDNSSAPPAPMMAHQPLPPIQPPSATMSHTPFPNQYQQMQDNRTSMHHHHGSISSQSGHPMYAQSQASDYGGTNGTSQNAIAPVDTTCLTSADETLFMQVFVEEVGLWMDSMDPHKHVRWYI